MFQNYILANVVFTFFALGLVLYFKRNLRRYAFIAFALAFSGEAILKAMHQNFLSLLWLVLAVASVVRYRIESNNAGKNDLGRALAGASRSKK